MEDHEKSACKTCKTYVLNTVGFPTHLCGSWPPGIVGRERPCLHLTLERSESTGLARTIANIDHFTALPTCFCKTFAKLSVSGQEGSSSTRSNILRLVKLSITSELFKGIWLLTWINLASLSEKFASARCPWRNHDAVLDSLHQTSDVHRCSFLMMHCQDMQRYAKMCRDVQRYAKLIWSVQSFEECRSDYGIGSLICFSQFLKQRLSSEHSPNGSRKSSISRLLAECLDLPSFPTCVTWSLVEPMDYNTISKHNRVVLIQEQKNLHAKHMFETQLAFQHTSVDLDHLESLVENDLACTWHLKDLKARVLQGPLRTLTTLPLCPRVFVKPLQNFQFRAKKVHLQIDQTYFA